jgi:predicted  nucleic acid-binding Zn-ribbon protein
LKFFREKKYLVDVSTQTDPLTEKLEKIKELKGLLESNRRRNEELFEISRQERAMTQRQITELDVRMKKLMGEIAHMEVELDMTFCSTEIVRDKEVFEDKSRREMKDREEGLKIHQEFEREFAILRKDSENDLETEGEEVEAREQRFTEMPAENSRPKVEPNRCPRFPKRSTSAMSACSVSDHFTAAKTNRKVYRLNLRNEQLTTEVRSLKKELESLQNQKERLQDEIDNIRKEDRNNDKIKIDDLNEMIKEQNDEAKELKDNVGKLVSQEIIDYS